MPRKRKPVRQYEQARKNPNLNLRVNPITKAKWAAYKSNFKTSDEALSALLDLAYND